MQPEYSHLYNPHSSSKDEVEMHMALNFLQNFSLAAKNKSSAVLNQLNQISYESESYKYNKDISANVSKGIKRNVHCTNYSRCLNIASKLNWKSFKCTDCIGEPHPFLVKLSNKI